MRTIVTLLAAAAFFGTAGAAEKEREIPLKDIPPEIKAAADKAVPGAKWQKAEQEKEKGQIIYELKGKGPEKDRMVEVEVTPDGKLIQTEVEVPLNEVPDVVRNKLKSGWPDFKPEEVKAITREDGTQGYEFEGPGGAKGKELEIFISGDGKTVDLDED
jgi:hypothetical protein